MEKYYAGIGSRKTPIDIQDDMVLLATMLRRMGFILRSGGALGADVSFEMGALDKKEVFTANSNIPDKAFEIAKEVHPAWNNCSPYAKRLHARNVLQVLGQNLDNPVEFVAVWTPDGCETLATRTFSTGGSGQAIALADTLDIPIYNLKNTNRLDDLCVFLESYRC
jgi:hypothetical protein